MRARGGDKDPPAGGDAVPRSGSTIARLVSQILIMIFPLGFPCSASSNASAEWSREK